MCNDVQVLQEEIRHLLRQKNAILLAHYYQRDEIQEIADFLGDSLALSMNAARTKADVIVFAGVHFMAESAAILCPEKTVLLPRLKAGCPLADTITAEELETARKQYPDAAVVTYINSSAAVKAKSDIICTSANAVRVVNSIKDRNRILMVPDGNLARYTARFTDKEIIPWRGFCPVHHYVTPDEVKAVKAHHPGAKFAAHPECTEEVLALADFIGSTTGIIRYARETDAKEIIIGTERGVMYQLRMQNPNKTFILASERLFCETMRSITLEDVRDALEEMKHIITVPAAIAAPAKKALDRMLEIS
ncbi:MAG: quinolinate synthase NadA [Deltaproteobacteria bacterium]|nr:quinolinate synthase NadA [Deltaproteobacteria bacterium]